MVRPASTQASAHSSPRATRSITRTLLTSALAVYFLLTLIITSAQVAFEYQNTRTNLLNDLRSQHHTFAASIARALWEFNLEQAEALAAGLANVPAVSGVIVRDDQGSIISVHGITQSSKQLADIHSAGEIPEQDGIFGYYSPIVFELAERSEVVGDVLLFSNRDITINRLKPSVVTLLLGALIKSTLLIILFSLAFKVYLRAPLTELIRQIRSFNPEQPEQHPIQLQQAESNEFSLLEDAYNDLCARLRSHQIDLLQTQSELAAANHRLEEQNAMLEHEIANKTLGISNLMLDLERRRHELEVRQRSLETEIHQRRITESKLKQSNKELEESLEFLQQTRLQLVSNEKMATLGNLVASITHEVNTPLGVSLTANSYLRERVAKLAQQLADTTLTPSELDKFIAQCSEGLQLTEQNLLRANELLTGFKQVAVDQSSQSLRAIELQDYVQRVVKTLYPTLKRKQVQVQVNCPPEVVVCNAGALGQILTNMIMNSIQHGFAEQTHGKIEISAELNEQQLTFRYQDNGAGLSSNALQRLFEPFYTTRAESGGSGLGAHIIYQLIHDTLGGTISAESKLGKGLTYHFSFPITLSGQN